MKAYMICQDRLHTNDTIGTKTTLAGVVGRNDVQRTLLDPLGCCNLRANHVDGQIVAAERVSTAPFVMFPGHAYLRVIEAMHGEQSTTAARNAYVKTKPVQGTGAQHLREAMTAEAYGHRPTDSACWWLSPYEFTMHWKSCERGCHTVEPSGKEPTRALGM